MRALATLAVCSLALAGCQSSREPNLTVASTQSHTLSPAQVGIVKAVVLADLKDPYSAHFGRILSAKTALSNGLNGYVVCGEVNSKNSYGGYVGMSPFIGAFKPDGKEFKVVAMGGPVVMTAEVTKYCAEAGITF
ncbi:hypothetical protein ASF34_01270 [Methylobacterium sp. Leaf106]|nr:hypothetical protein ASF34_01270 [Methylobacterium sp. Leaf106]